MNTDNKPQFQPENDGKNHINVYSKGETYLGRQLSNFANTPFTFKSRKFASVEGWWYYYMTGNEEVCMMYGWKCKEFGRSLQHTSFEAPTKELLFEVYLTKLHYNKFIEDLLKQSELPFTHYYAYGNLKRITCWEWTGALWEEVRKYVRGELPIADYLIPINRFQSSKEEDNG